VDSISIVDRKGGAQGRRILRARGWVSPDVKGNKSADSIIVLFRTEDGIQFSCEAARHDRHDVASGFRNPALVETGFSTEVDTSVVGGKSTLLLATRSGDELKLCPNVSIPLATLAMPPLDADDATRLIDPGQGSSMSGRRADKQARHSPPEEDDLSILRAKTQHSNQSISLITNAGFPRRRR
jgi:hypothetical protein